MQFKVNTVAANYPKEKDVNLTKQRPVDAGLGGNK